MIKLLTLLLSLCFVIEIDGLNQEVCDGKPLNIWCEKGTSIKIHNAWYCSAIDCNVCCNRHPLLCLVRKMCDKEQACIFKPNKFVSDGDCPPGTKCFSVDFSCIIDTRKEPKECAVNQEWTKCRTACPEMCPKQYPKPPPEGCIKMCYPPGCQCKPGYLIDPYTAVCVLEEYCPQPECHKHERFSCCNADLQRRCPIWYKPVGNETTAPTTTVADSSTGCLYKDCVPGYVCKRPYYRNPFTNCCVTIDECPIF